jgi:hypothetical protein
MSKHPNMEYKRRRRAKAREKDRLIAGATVRWYKASECGVALGVCQWNRRNSGTIPDIICTNEAKWVMESPEMRWCFCHQHASYVHTSPSLVKSFVGKNRMAQPTPLIADGAP